MRAMGRLEAMQKFIELQPNDPFPRYGVAMELKNLGRLDEAEAAFAELERRFPDYVPQYLMRFNVLAALGRKDDARQLAGRGLETIRRAGNGHAEGELAQALAALDEE